MKLINIYLLSLLSASLFLGCSSNTKDAQKPPEEQISSEHNTSDALEPRLDELHDVSYEVDSSGEVTLKKHYTTKGAEVISREDINSKSGSKPHYTKVPTFSKDAYTSYSKNGKTLYKEDIALKGKAVKVSVEKIPVNEFIDLVFGSVLQINYHTNKDVQELTTPITLNMSHEQPRKEFYEVVKKLLAQEGIVISSENGTLFISKDSKKRPQFLSTDLHVEYGRQLSKRIPNSKKIFMYVPYYYVRAVKAQPLLSKIGLKTLKTSYPKGNLQLLEGSAEDIRKALAIINLIDTPRLEGKSIYLVELDNIKSVKFIDELKKIMDLSNIPIATNNTSVGIRLDSLDDINALLVLTPKREWFDLVLYWKKKLDVPPKLSEEPQLYIYHVQNRRADELAESVNAMLGLSVKKKTDKETNKDVAGDNKQTEKKQTTTVAPVAASTLIKATDYTPSVTADIATNILMLKLKPKHYQILMPTIEELDSLPLQTLVEVTIAEVDMTDTFSLGFEWAITNQGSGLADLVNIIGGGSGLGIIFSGDKINMTVNALAEDKLLDIVSRPKLLILNNETGNINVGTQVPIITSETSAPDIPDGSINRNVSYRTTGVTMGVTPTINSEGILTMAIELSLSEAQLNDTSNIDSPLIVDRKLSTVAVIKSGDTIMIGGLISRNISTSDSGIPLLKDIPWLGAIFKSQSKKTVKTELIMLIRPTIIKSPQHIKNETIKFQALLKHLNYI